MGESNRPATTCLRTAGPGAPRSQGTQGPPRSSGCGGRRPQRRFWTSCEVPGWGASPPGRCPRRRRVMGMARAAKGRRTGRARRKCNFPCFLFSEGWGIGAFFPLLFPLFIHLFPLFGRFMGTRRTESPTRTDHFGLGQDMVMKKCRCRCHGPLGRM